MACRALVRDGRFRRSATIVANVGCRLPLRPRFDFQNRQLCVDSTSLQTCTSGPALGCGSGGVVSTSSNAGWAQGALWGVLGARANCPSFEYLFSVTLKDREPRLACGFAFSPVFSFVDVVWSRVSRSHVFSVSVLSASKDEHELNNCRKQHIAFSIGHDRAV